MEMNREEQKVEELQGKERIGIGCKVDKDLYWHFKLAAMTKQEKVTIAVEKALALYIKEANKKEE